MNIKETALRLAKSMRDKSGYTTLDLVCNAEAFAEALVAELAKENKPVYYLWENKYGDPQQMLSSNSGPHPEYVITALYTLPPTAEQIEQETAEAIAKHFEQSGIGGEYLAEAIRSGAWKEYL